MAENKRLTYEAPQALRLGEVQCGAGTCSPGSGDPEQCYLNGNSASSYGCAYPGDSAVGGYGCTAPGNSASVCDTSGSGVGG